MEATLLRHYAPGMAVVPRALDPTPLSQLNTAATCRMVKS